MVLPVIAVAPASALATAGCGSTTSSGSPSAAKTTVPDLTGQTSSKQGSLDRSAPAWPDPSSRVLDGRQCAAGTVYFVGGNSNRSPCPFLVVEPPKPRSPMMSSLPTEGVSYLYESQSPEERDELLQFLPATALISGVTRDAQVIHD
jgi:hypothetical protein